jgi:uncharacterized protein (DUF488 family)
MLLSYGHGTETAGRTAAILAAAGVASLVDIRITPGSRRNPQFTRAALEEWLRRPEFAAAADAVLAEANQRLVAVMCSESQWRSCHRQLPADFAVVARGVEVRHLLHEGGTEAHRPSDGLRRRDDGLLVYDAGQQTLL